MKHLEHFNLSEDPFKKKMFFETKANREAVERMRITVESGGIMHLTGKYGVGKTELLDNFISGLHSSEKAVLLNYTTLSPFCFLLNLSNQLGLPNRNNTANIVTQIHNYIHKSASKIIFIIDESHNLNTKTIEAVKLILNPYLSGDTVSVILSSPPEMKEVLAVCPSFKQRIRMTYTLQPLSIEESKNYFYERLRKSGCPDIIFNNVINSIIERTEGIPRLINNFGTYCIITAASLHKKIIDDKVIEIVLKELSLN